MMLQFNRVAALIEKLNQVKKSNKDIKKKR
jgi:hypothetical protein